MRIIHEHLVTQENVDKYYDIYSRNLAFWKDKLYTYEKEGRYDNEPSLATVNKNIEENTEYLKFMNKWSPVSKKR